MFTTVIQVAFGGALGAIFRYGVGTMVAFPFGTLAVNIIGSFIMGIAFVMLPERLMPFVMVGVLGGFTTFSAFSLDVFKLIEAGRISVAGTYILGSVALSLAAIFTAIYIAKAFQG